MKFDWEPPKAKWNLAKHKVSFEEAATALLDTLARTSPDRILIIPLTNIVSLRLVFR
jgi:uncharacterized DUF497 family protein